MIIDVSNSLLARLEKESVGLNCTIEQRIQDILEKTVAPQENLEKGFIDQGVQRIKELLEKITCINSVGTSVLGEPFWWLKFAIDIDSPIAWNVIQELGHILNYLSLNDKLPTCFYPVSSPPYLNGGPKEFLYWVIEPSLSFVNSNLIADYLVGRLPENLEDDASWILE